MLNRNETITEPYLFFAVYFCTRVKEVQQQLYGYFHLSPGDINNNKQSSLLEDFVVVEWLKLHTLTWTIRLPLKPRANVRYF